MSIFEVSLLGGEEKGGLTNKLFMLCTRIHDIMRDGNVKIIDPILGWRTAVNFSHIFDVDYFNDKFEELYGIKNIIILRDGHPSRGVNVLSWDDKSWKRTSHKLRVEMFQLLKPVKELEHIINSHDVTNKTTIQLRIESDWLKHSNKRFSEGKISSVDELYTNLQSIIKMFKESEIFNNDIFFTTGENHDQVVDSFRQEDITSSYYYNPDLEYDTNAMINFFICARSNTYIGHCNSTFSNMITAARYESGNNNSFIYNYHNSIKQRYDNGEHHDPSKVIDNMLTSSTCSI